MIQQDFPVPVPSRKHKTDTGKNHIWEVRHAGLLGIKYEVAVRNDLFDQHAIKQEEESIDTGKEVLRGVVDAAILGCVYFGLHLLSTSINSVF
jgi:TATA-binding protein-associated factor